MNKKRLIILLIVILAGGVMLTILAVLPGRKIQQTDSDGQLNTPAPELLGDTDKTGLGVAPETQAQVLERNSDGNIMVYKIID